MMVARWVLLFLVGCLGPIEKLGLHGVACRQLKKGMVGSYIANLLCPVW